MDGQFSPVGELQNACERESELSRARKDYAHFPLLPLAGF